MIATNARADDAEVAAMRERVERAETVVKLREREAEAARREQRLREAPRDEPRDRARARRFSRRGRLVFTDLVGYSSFGLSPFVPGYGALAAPGPSGLVSMRIGSTERGASTVRTSAFALSPSVDAFVGEHLTLGLSATAFRYALTTSQSDAIAPGGARAYDSSGYGVGFEPRVGYAVDVGPVALWPRAGVGWGVTRHESGLGADASSRSLIRTLSAMASLDVVFLVTDHLVLSLGPELRFQKADARADGPAAFSDADQLALGGRAHVGVTF